VGKKSASAMTILELIHGGLVALEPVSVDTWQNTDESACHVWTRLPDRASLIPDDATRRDVTEWLQGYSEQGGQERDENAVVPQARDEGVWEGYHRDFN
jgi:hypothetical protein